MKLMGKKLKRSIAVWLSAIMIMFNFNLYILVEADTINKESNIDKDGIPQKDAQIFTEATSSNAEDNKSFYFNTSLDGYSITLRAESNVLLQDTVVKIKKVDKIGRKSIDDIISDEITQSERVIDIVAFDISLWSKGIEIQPENGGIKVSIKPLKMAGISKENNIEDTAEIFHITEGGKASQIAEDSLEDGKADFTAEHFSIYALAMLGATGGHTQADAENWIDGKLGSAIDYDGHYGVQCVDLISLYYQYLGYNIFNYVVGGGYAYTFAYSPLPPGWVRYGNNVNPQPGDIVVFGANQYGAYGTGHIGIIRAVDNSSYKYLDYNGTGHNDGGTWRWKPLRNFTNIIRPDFVSPPPPPPSPPDHLDPPAGGSDDSIADGDYTIVSGVAEGRSIAWEGNADINGQNVFLRDFYSWGDYVWTLERQSDDSFIIRSKQSGKVLDVYGGPTSFGNEKNIQVWEEVEGNSNQRWYIVRNGDGYRLIAKHSGFSLDIYGGNSADGTNIWQYYPNESSAQRFYLIKHELPNVSETSASEIKDNATYIIRSKLDTSKGITTESDPNNMSNGRNVYLWEYNTANIHPAHIWRFEKQSDGSFLIKNTFNDQYMDVVWYSLSDRVNILTWERHYKPSESWYIVKNEDNTYRFVNKNSGKVVDITGAQTSNGVNIQQYIWHGHDAQKFYLERYPAPVEYTVVFKAPDGSILSTQTVEEGEAAVVPQAPAIEGYQFAGWEGDYNNINSDRVITAKYNKIQNNNLNNGDGGSSSGGGGGSSGGGGGGSGSGGGFHVVDGGSGVTPVAGTASNEFTWEKDDKGWWIKNSDGSYPKSEWKKVNGNWYFFNAEGYMVVGWLKLNDNWYYLDATDGSGNGRMFIGWVVIGDKWYYLSTAADATNGIMLFNTTVDGYTLGADGAWDGQAKK